MTLTSLEANYSSTKKTQFLIDEGTSLNWVGGTDFARFERYFVFIDTNVAALWGDQIITQLRASGKPIFLKQVAPEEDSKSTRYLPEALAFLENNSCTRFDLIMAVGGGIVIDLASFVASIYMRGVPLYIMATTLIGQMDASTAGKTCLNTDQGKNVLGTFYYPERVYNNIDLLKTNTPYFNRQGLSEIFKYGLLNSTLIIDTMSAFQLTPSNSLLASMVRLSIESRVAIASKDPLASNLGHTFGHAIEKISNYGILHGDAISVGTVISLYFSKKQGLLTEATLKTILGLMKKFGLNIYIDKAFDPAELVRLMMRDKKSSSVNLNLVLICDIAKPYSTKDGYFYQAQPAQVESFLRNFLSNYEYTIADCADYIRNRELKYEAN
jgi:3-dehydroquinate synthase